jgi:hypothetical protein
MAGALAHMLKKPLSRREINGEFGECQIRSQMREV